MRHFYTEIDTMNLGDHSELIKYSGIVLNSKRDTLKRVLPWQNE